VFSVGAVVVAIGNSTDDKGGQGGYTPGARKFVLIYVITHRLLPEKLFIGWAAISETELSNGHQIQARVGVK
jgi:hypothetical protein